MPPPPTSPKGTTPPRWRRGFDTTYFGECKGENFDLLNPTFIMDANGEPAVDIQGTPMVKYTLASRIHGEDQV